MTFYSTSTTSGGTGEACRGKGKKRKKENYLSYIKSSYMKRVW
jgi:hypothetical protein